MTRPCSSDDIPAVMALQKSLENEDALFGYVADSREDWSRRNLTWTHVALDEGALVGFIHCAPRAYAGECVFPAHARILEILELVVAAGSPRRRHGRDLLAAAEEQARAEGFTHLRVYSAAKRFDEVVRFYRDCGFAPWFLEMTQEL